MPQPEDVKFEQRAEEKLIEDEAEIARAKVGPDIHCYYCGSRNPADAETCSQCGATLSEGTARESGSVLGAHRDEPAEPITCPNCGATNKPNAAKCVQCGASLARAEPEVKPEAAGLKAQATPAGTGRSKTFGMVGLIIFLLICGACIGFFVLYNRTEATTGQVQAVEWTRNVAIEALTPVTLEGWREEIPPGAIIGTCTRKVHHTEEQSTGNTREICGTPYTVDTGSGYGEVVQDCTTEEIMEMVEVLADSCQYTVEEWQQIDQVTLRGTDTNPRWPDPPLRTGQREGEREEKYRITFRTEEGSYTYITSNSNLFNQAQIGSRWILQVNSFNDVTNIEPAR
jgi:ribosomal protein L40E